MCLARTARAWTTQQTTVRSVAWLVAMRLVADCGFGFRRRRVGRCQASELAPSLVVCSVPAPWTRQTHEVLHERQCNTCEGRRVQLRVPPLLGAKTDIMRIFSRASLSILALSRLAVIHGQPNPYGQSKEYGRIKLVCLAHNEIERRSW